MVCQYHIRGIQLLTELYLNTNYDVIMVQHTFQNPPQNKLNSINNVII